MKRITPYEFIKRANEIHKNKYDYSLIKHLYATDKVPIICPTHGKFDQKVSLHLKGNGCPKCGVLSRAEKRRKAVDDFIKDSKEVHGDGYQYDKVKYVNSSTKVTITCSVHGDFEQTPSAHINQKQGCSVCGGSQKMTSEIFILKAQEVHKDKFNYDKVSY